MKRPSFQFYPADWLRDTALRTCTAGARGLWMDMICYMHQGTPYGHLKVGNKVILPPNLSCMVGATLQEVEGWLVELESAGVFDRTEEGAIYSRRMIRDETIRQSRAAGGKLGGNPALKVNHKVNHKVETEDKQKPTPSSSSSSSDFLLEDGVEQAAKPPKARGTIEQLRAYAKEIGLPESDGESRFYGWESNGWMTGKNKIKDWKAAMRTWKANRWLPSQQSPQTNGRPQQRRELTSADVTL